MPQDPTEIDRAVRVAVYGAVVGTTLPPTVDQVAAKTGFLRDEVAASFRRLDENRALVLERGTLNVRMANPFSAVPTPFGVETPQRTFYGNCIWDSLGIPAALHTSATIRTKCPDECGEEIVLRVDRDQGLEPMNGMVHFSLPARKWWDDIVFT